MNEKNLIKLDNGETVNLGSYSSIEEAAEDDFSTIPVPKLYRHNWSHIMFVWFGAAMVAQLYVAGVNLTLNTGGIKNAMLSILGGILFLGLFVAFNGVIGQKTGCGAALSATYAYGTLGVAIPSFHIADIGWYVVNIAVFSEILHTLIPSIDIKVFCILLCYLFITNGYVGFNQMVVLNRIAAPILIIVSIIGLYKLSVLTDGGILALFDKAFPENMSIGAGVTAVIGTWSAGASRSADYFRYAKSVKDTFLASMIGFVVGFLLCICCGVLWGAYSGTSSIGETLAMLNIVIVGGIMFFVQTWTTSEHSSYITSTSLPLAINVVTGKKIPRRFIILLCGVIGICISGLDIQNYYIPFISFLGAVLPVLGGIVIADYFIMARIGMHWTGIRDPYSLSVLSNKIPKFNPCVVPALIIGVIASLKLNIGIAAVNGILVTMLVYCLSCWIYVSLKNKN